jgi:hypothetical protein
MLGAARRLNHPLVIVAGHTRQGGGSRLRGRLVVLQGLAGALTLGVADLDRVFALPQQRAGLGDLRADGLQPLGHLLHGGPFQRTQAKLAAPAIRGGVPQQQQRPASTGPRTAREPQPQASAQVQISRRYDGLLGLDALRL